MNPRTAFKTIRSLGPRTTFRRIVNAIKVKSGYIELIDKALPFGVEQLKGHLRDGLTPLELLAAHRAERQPFFFDLTDIQEASVALSRFVGDQARVDLLARTERLKSGVVEFFSARDYDLGRPLNWHIDPQANVQWPSDRHWRHYSQFDPTLSDIKLVWEASRFAFCFDLVRAYGLTTDSSWLLLGLDLIDEWIEGNPSGRGVQWTCGQETAFRLMAWSSLLRAAADAHVLDAQRFARIAASIYRQTLRIERCISFSRSIRNNHSLSEAAGLFSVGVLFPQFDRSAIWRQKGKEILQNEVAYQVFGDGSYIQHSMNYHRLMLCDCVWVARLAELHGESMSPGFTERAGRATEFLCGMMDWDSGRVPNYGSNDGALILPLTSCDFLDFRPFVQAAARQFNKRLVLPAGEYDEILFWLFGPEKMINPGGHGVPQSKTYEIGGYFTFRAEDAWGMIRCHSYGERPAHADMLHFDLWRGGENILRDAGSYKYYCSAPWQNHFKSTAAHNTIEVAGRNQMPRGPRFMWYEWCKSRFLGRGAMPDEEGEWWEGEHYGYRRRFGIVHSRRIERRGADRWTVIDTLLGDRNVSAILRWHMIDRDCQFDEPERTLTMPLEYETMRLSVTAEDGVIAGARVLRGAASADTAEGWESLYYSEKRPTPVLCVDLVGHMPLTIETHICFSGASAN